MYASPHIQNLIDIVHGHAAVQCPYGTISDGILVVVCLGALATLVIGLGHYKRKQPSTKL